jgi:tetratricopeptide (TPR) repeat protein
MEATMHRALYLAGLGYLAICGMLVLRHRRPSYESIATEPAQTPLNFSGPSVAWWVRMKARCNPVEVELAHRMTPAPHTLDGQGYSAACYALAGKIDSARAIIDRLPASDRYKAAGMVFDVAHPIADAGDDRAAGPIMELVIGYWPNHYMALYHAGMAEYALGESEPARKNLTAFLSFYHQNDGWTRNARLTLARLGVEK